MKNFIYICLSASLLLVHLSACNSSRKSVQITDQEQMAFRETEQDTVTIADDESDYEIVIIEPGFQTWLSSVARPEGYYSQSFLENRNEILVTNWNQRVLEPLRYDPMLYEMQINYDPGVDYGYDVNYKLYNYFIYFQRKYNQRLGPFLPRI